MRELRRYQAPRPAKNFENSTDFLRILRPSSSLRQQRGAYGFPKADPPDRLHAQANDSTSRRPRAGEAITSTFVSHKKKLTAIGPTVWLNTK